MEETTTTTDAGTSDTGAVAEPEQNEQQTAANQPAEPKTESQGPSNDDNLTWLTNKGIDPNSPEALAKVAEMYRNAEKVMHESTQKASDLQKSISEASQDSGIMDGVVDEATQRLNRLELDLNVEKFFKQDGIDPDLRPAMAEYAQANPHIAALVENNVMTLQQMYDMVRGSDPGLLDKARQDGGREALTKVAEKQQARAIQGNATTSAVTQEVTKDNFDEWYSGLSSADRAKPETQAIVNDLLSN